VSSIVLFVVFSTVLRLVALASDAVPGLEHTQVLAPERLLRALLLQAFYTIRSVHRPIQRLGQLAARPILGGLHQQYCRI
jgi:hypothetical protein